MEENKEYTGWKRWKPTNEELAEFLVSGICPIQLKENEYLIIDDGEGMSPETLKKAIEPFFSTKPIGKGTGLGLSMVHGLAEQLGGTLELTSTVGQGTTATLILPATSAAPVVVDESPAEAPAPVDIDTPQVFSLPLFCRTGAAIWK